MEVQFANNRLRRCYEDGSMATQEWGPNVGRKYIQRIGILFAAQHFDDLFAIKSLRIHRLVGDRAGGYALTLHAQWRLILTDDGDDSVAVKEVTNHYGD